MVTKSNKNVRFFFIINKWANFYFFVQNLSEWHFSCRQAYNELWRKELGGLSDDEEKKLKLFASLHKKYSFGKDFFGQTFFSNKDPLKKIKNQMPQKKFVLLTSIFSAFLPHFNKIYEKDYIYLKKWKKTLEKSHNRKSLINQLNKSLAILYNTKPLQKEIYVYLLFSSPNHSGGSTSGNGENISLEISRYSLNKVNHAVGIIWHEFIHLYFEKKYFLPLLQKKLNKNQKTINFLKEITASSLLPNGILGKFLLKVSEKTLNARISSKHDKQILSLTKKYVEGNRFLDENYIKSISEIIFSSKKIEKKTHWNKNSNGS